MLAACLVLLSAVNPPDVVFRLENGLKVILIPQPGHPVAVVALGVHAVVYDEPEGRCGLAHLTEHFFWYGSSKSYAANQAFEKLSQDGPLGIPFVDANAETMQNLTYFYTGRPSAGVETALEVFAEKLAQVTGTPELLEVERKKVLAEIEQVQANMKARPALQNLAAREARYPKAGIASHVPSLTLEHVVAFYDSHYRPDRCVLLVQGAFDADRIRPRIEKLYGSCRPRNGTPVEDGPLKDIPEQTVVSYSCPGTTARERTALRVAAAAWELELRKKNKAYAETAGDGTVCVVLFGSDSKPIQDFRDTLHEPLAENVFRQARTHAGERARMYKGFFVSAGDPQKAKDIRACTRTMLQSAIDRLRFEAEGGQEFLEALDATSREDVAAAARKFLTAERERVRKVQP